MLGRRAFLKLFSGSIFGLIALGGYAFGYEPVVRLNVTRYALTPPRWTPGLKLRIVALADFHACEPWMSAERIAAICTRANELGGDIIVLQDACVVKHFHGEYRNTRASWAHQKRLSIT